MFVKKLSRRLIKYLILFVVAELILQYENQFLLPRNFYVSAENEQAVIHQILPEQKIQGTLNPRETISYHIYLIEGQFARVNFNHSGSRIKGKLFDTDSQLFAEFKLRSNELTPVFIIAKTTGVYQIQLSAQAKSEHLGKYEIVVEQTRMANEKDRYLVEAGNELSKAESLRQQWKLETFNETFQNYENAINNWEKGGEIKETIYTHRTLGEYYLELVKTDKALSHFQQALTLSRKIQDVANQSLNLSNISAALLLQGNKQEAGEKCQEGLNLAREIGESMALARSLVQVGDVGYYNEDLEKSLNSYQEALLIWQKLDNWYGQGLTYLYLGYASGQLNKVNETFDYYSKALKIWEDIDDSRNQAITLVGIGHFHTKLGEFQKALVKYSQAKVMFENSPAQTDLASLLSGLGFIYESTGFFEKALEYRQQALKIYDEAKFKQAKEILLWRVAESYASLGENEKALNNYNEALTIAKEIKDGLFEAVILRSLGAYYEKGSDLQIAKSYYEKALQLNLTLKKGREAAYCLNNLGHLEEINSDFSDALKKYQDALSLNRENSDLLGESTTLFNIARVQQKQGNLSEAKLMMEAALLRVESLRSKIAGQDLRSSYFASVHELYENYIDLLMRLHQTDAAARFDIQAWQTSERARARSLFEALSKANQANSEIDKELLEKERALYKSLSEKEAKRLELLRKQAGEAEVKSINQEIDALTAELEELRIRIRGSEASRLETPDLVGLEELQSVLTNDAIVLEFSLGEKQSYLWAITRNSLQTFVLPARAEIENSAKILREALVVRQNLNREASLAEQRAQIQEAEQKFQQESVNLSRMLLNQLPLTNQKLLIIPAGALQYVPFEALPLPNQQVPLITNHEIVYQPSAATLTALEKTVANRKSTPKDVAVIADPVFSLNEIAQNTESVRSVDNAGQELLLTLRDAEWIDGNSNIPSLPASRVEAETILKNAGSSNNLSAIGFQASKSLATGEELKQYRIVHFATHGVLNPKNPEQSGLILSLYNEKGQPQDGFLRLSDIYALNLPSDLVVLSACSTGLGKEVRGEGLVGLTRGFLSSGAARTVSSLWKVDDEATAELMSGFYQTMLQHGLTPAAALREAKLKMMRESRWNAPYFWAGFVAQGEFKEKIEITRQNSLFNWQIYIGGIILLTLLASGYLIVRRVKSMKG
jgi:CHAT domain-containing protein